MRKILLLLPLLLLPACDTGPDGGDPNDDAETTAGDESGGDESGGSTDGDADGDEPNCKISGLLPPVTTDGDIARCP